MFNSYGNENLVVDQELVVTYSKGRVQGAWSYASGTSIITIAEAWEYRRFAAKRMRYVGMTKTAALACQAALISKFTRSITNSVWNASTHTFTTESGGSEVMANIVARHVAGHMWEVTCDIREYDTRLSTGNYSPSSLFTSENARDYSGVTGS